MLVCANSRHKSQLYNEPRLMTLFWGDLQCVTSGLTRWVSSCKAPSCSNGNTWVGQWIKFTAQLLLQLVQFNEEGQMWQLFRSQRMVYPFFHSMDIYWVLTLSRALCQALDCVRKISEMNSIPNVVLTQCVPLENFLNGLCLFPYVWNRERDKQPDTSQMYCGQCILIQIRYQNKFLK